MYRLVFLATIFLVENASIFSKVSIGQMCLPLRMAFSLSLLLDPAFKSVLN